MKDWKSNCKKSSCKMSSVNLAQRETRQLWKRFRNFNKSRMGELENVIQYFHGASGTFRIQSVLSHISLFLQFDCWNDKNVNISHKHSFEVRAKTHLKLISTFCACCDVIANLRKDINFIEIYEILLRAWYQKKRNKSQFKVRRPTAGGWAAE